MNILLVEDSKEVAEVIFDYFEDTELTLDYASNGKMGLSLAQTHDFDCIILDVMLPGIDGLSVCDQLRKSGCDTPIIMLTARDTRMDMLQGFKQGADDYIVKPFDMEILEARIHAVVRRGEHSKKQGVHRIGSLAVDMQSKQVWRGEQLVSLTPSGFKIIQLLVEQHPAVATRQQIEQCLWGEETPDQDILRKHIYQLRSKIDKPFAVDIIQTVPKIGYRLLEGKSS